MPDRNSNGQWIYRIVAILIIGAMVGIGFYVYPENNTHATQVEQITQEETVKTGSNEHKTIKFSKGSTITLNSNSSATYTFGEVMINEIIPMVDDTYRTIPDRENRAMAGLSMGGFQTFQTTLANVNTFSYIGGFSGAGFIRPGTDLADAYNWAFANPEEFNERVNLVWISIGTEEPERMYQNVNSFHKRLEEGGIQHEYYESPGTSHEWQTWRRNLYRLAPLLFKN